MAPPSGEDPLQGTDFAGEKRGISFCQNDGGGLHCSELAGLWRKCLISLV